MEVFLCLSSDRRGLKGVAMAGHWTLANACGPEWVAEGACSFRVWAPHGEEVARGLSGDQGASTKIIKNPSDH